MHWQWFSTTTYVFLLLWKILPGHVHLRLRPSPSAYPAPLRQRAMAHLRPVSMPDLVCDMAGKDPTRKIADFDRHYMPDGQPSPDASARGMCQ